MPKEWRDRWSAGLIEDEKKRELYRRIVVGRKPYFMRYVYPALMKQYNTYIKNTDKNAMREFGMTVPELKEIPAHERTENQNLFLKYYDIYMPVGMNDCVMNRICRRIEKIFDGFLGRKNKPNGFDYSVMKSGSEYTPRQFSSIRRLYEDYGHRVSSYALAADRGVIDRDDMSVSIEMLKDEFMRECATACPNESTLCDIVLDLCYTRSASKQFAWEMCGEQIIRNLLARTDGMISFPVKDVDGCFEFSGSTFSVKTKKIGVE